MLPGRMFTGEPGDNALAGPVDIRRPVSYNHDHTESERRRAPAAAIEALID